MPFHDSKTDFMNYLISSSYIFFLHKHQGKEIMLGYFGVDHTSLFLSSFLMLYFSPKVNEF